MIVRTQKATQRTGLTLQMWSIYGICGSGRDSGTAMVVL
jgi:hypothetical protein